MERTDDASLCFFCTPDIPLPPPPSSHDTGWLIGRSKREIFDRSADRRHRATSRAGGTIPPDLFGRCLAPNGPPRAAPRLLGMCSFPWPAVEPWWICLRGESGSTNLARSTGKPPTCSLASDGVDMQRAKPPPSEHQGEAPRPWSATIVHTACFEDASGRDKSAPRTGSPVLLLAPSQTAE